MSLADEIERCDREIAAIEAANQSEQRAFLVAMGLEDWRAERALLLGTPLPFPKRRGLHLVGDTRC